MAQRQKLPSIHPGELLRDELNEMGVSLNELGRALRVPMNRISAIVNGKRAITQGSVDGPRTGPVAGRTNEGGRQGTETQEIHEGFGSRKFRGIDKQARKPLNWLDAAKSLTDLAPFAATGWKR